MIERIDQQATALKASSTTATTAAKAVQSATKNAQAAPAAANEIALEHKTDRVEISEQGYASLTQSKGAEATTTKAITEEAAKATAKATTATSTEAATAAATEAATKATTEATTEDSEETATNTANLTNLTVQQLETLVKDGSISRAQADIELSRRQGE